MSFSHEKAVYLRLLGMFSLVETVEKVLVALLDDRAPELEGGAARVCSGGWGIARRSSSVSRWPAAVSLANASSPSWARWVTRSN